ncbi:MAG TPA: hypothetical protein VGA37_12940 [Gemmatimonadales bacterium]
MIADFRDLLAAFVSHDVRFLVVGAHALAAHGVPRVTADSSSCARAVVVAAGGAWPYFFSFPSPIIHAVVHTIRPRASE